METAFLKKSFKLYFDLCWRAEINIQVGLNIHLYVGIGLHRRPFDGRHLVFYLAILNFDPILWKLSKYTWNQI